MKVEPLETIGSMAKHRRPGPPNQPSGAVPQIDPDALLAAYDKRRQPPVDAHRRHLPVHGGAGHLRPDEPRVLEEWDGFAYQLVGTAPDLAGAREWVTREPDAPWTRHVRLRPSFLTWPPERGGRLAGAVRGYGECYGS
jgi:hypothetical protein